MHDGYGHSHAEGAEAADRGETAAMLKYLAHHNEHHAEELHEIAHTVTGKASELLHEAVEELLDSSRKIRDALRLLEEEKEA